ncbi:acyl-CoA dehydrogenase family protein [Rhodococcus sp. NPDC057014]|uniref:acyl-CoA dehydrogenase family protein n=1 Tax=Rhodococcus sp. NPDC057014 TaxID=3346000 RepID=UPI00362EE472
MHRPVYTADHDDFRTVARNFVDRSLRANEENLLRAGMIDRAIWLDAGAHDLLGLHVPEEYGGAGVDDYRYSAVLGEELGKFTAGAASSFGIHVDCAAPYLVELGTDEQRRRWLPGFCSGEIITAIGMTEPSGGSDLAALKTTAIADGDDWILKGSKIFITNGIQADLVIVAARTSPEKGAKGITLFGVEAGMAGFVRGRKLDKVGQLDSDTAELFFDDVRVPATNVIGEVDRGFVAMMERLPQERISGAVNNIANAGQILTETIGYVRERKAFGQAVGSFQHNKFLIAELVTKVEITQAFVDRCITEHAAGQLSAVDAAKAKWWTAEVQNQVLDACVQLHGGYGFMNEYRVARAWKDARVTKIWAGSNEIMKELIGRDLGL